MGTSLASPKPGAAVPDTNPYAEGLAALSSFFVGESSVEETLLRIADIAVASSPASFAGVTLLVDGRPTTAVFTDPESPEIDTAQYETGDGPCLSAFRHQDTCRITDTRTEPRWRAFCEACVEHDILSTLSLPLVGMDEPAGALNLYATKPNAFDDYEGMADAFARAASAVVHNATAYWDARHLGENLTEAMRSRAVIEQAKGMLMARSKLTPDESFDLLRKASQRENVKLRDIAQRIVDRESPPSV
jgi:GAF domain-containing protein